MTSVYTRTQFLAYYPNNEVRFVSRPVVKSNARREPSRLKVLPECPPYVDVEDLISEDKAGALACALVADALAVATRGRVATDLDRSAKFEDTKTELLKNGYGLIKENWPSFSSRARRAVSLRAAAIDHVFPKNQQAFLTGTLPGSTPEALRTFAAWSSWIMHRVQVWLYDNYSVNANFKAVTVHYASSDRNCYHLAVWEHQKRGALHYHGLVATPRACELIGTKETPGTFKVFWIELLEQLCEKTGVDLFARFQGGSWRGAEHFDKIQVFCQTVKKSISAYLSKYLTKEAAAPKELAGPPPARWWASTRAMKALCAAKTIFLPLPAGTAEQSEDLLEQVLEIFTGLAPFSTALRNPYLDVQTGSLGIFDTFADALDAFDMLDEYLSGYLLENEQDIELLQRLDWHNAVKARKLRDSIDADTSYYYADYLYGSDRDSLAYKTLSSRWDEFMGICNLSNQPQTPANSYACSMTEHLRAILESSLESPSAVPA